MPLWHSVKSYPWRAADKNAGSGLMLVRSGLVWVVPDVHRALQHFKDDRCRPAEQQDTVHRGHRAEQAPALDGHNVAVAKRRVVHESKIQKVAPRRSSAQDPVSKRPYDHLGDMCHEQDSDRCHHNGTEPEPRTSAAPLRSTARHVLDHRREDSMDADVAETDYPTQKKLSQHGERQWASKTSEMDHRSISHLAHAGLEKSQKQ
jgi:hypothetical protein